MRQAVLAWLDFPLAPTAGGAVVLLIIVGYRLIIDRSAVKSEISQLTRQVLDLTTKVEHLEVQYDEQRSLKHKAANDVARTTLALDLVHRLAQECTCGVLGPLPGIIEGVLNELETARRAPTSQG